MNTQSRTLLTIFTLLTCLVLLNNTKSQAQTGLTGFVRNYNAVQTIPDYSMLVGRNRLRLNLDKSISSGEIVASGEVQNFYNRSVDSLVYSLREAYIDLYFQNSDLTVGRKIISWGRADGTFITDILSPVNFSEFLTQDFADIRTGLDAIMYTRYFGSDYLQLVVNPVFRSNTTPRADSRWFPRPFFGESTPTEIIQHNANPTLKNAQAGARLALRSSLDFDLDLSLLYWHYPNPGYDKDFKVDSQQNGILQLNETFTQSMVFMYSGTLQLTSRLLLKSEAAYYTRRMFDYLTEELRSINFNNPTQAQQARIVQIFETNTDGFLRERPWLIGMAGLEYNLLDWTIGGQLIDEYIFNYDDQIMQQEHYTYMTLLLQRSFLRDKLEFRGFGRYNLDGQDFWVNPELTYTGIDNFEAAAGTQLFGGPEPDSYYGHLSFKNYAQNSFGYLQVTAYF